MGNPFVRNLCSERANTKGNTGSMHGLNMVSTPPKNTNRATVICCTLYPQDRRTAHKITAAVRYVCLYITTLSGIPGNSAKLERGGPCWLLRSSLLVR